MTSKATVDYSFLGNSGLKVSNICLGAMTFGTCGENESAMSIVSCDNKFCTQVRQNVEAKYYMYIVTPTVFVRLH